MLIPCPHCGPREAGQFTCGGDASRTRPAPDAPEADWCDYVYQRANPKGAHREFWQHTGGCRAIFAVSRDVTTHEVPEEAPAEVAPAAAPEPVPEPAKQPRTACHRAAAGSTATGPVAFAFDGRAMSGVAGDTLASALLANGRRLVARSFKVHRPRGIMSAGPEEASALVTIGERGRSDPNVKAPMVPLFHGLVARSQNAWPSLRLDAMAANGLGGGALAAEFYYKTFLSGSARRWTKLFEPTIRRAAGMGRASLEPDPVRYETLHTHCDVLVIGGGPFGLAAARRAAGAGQDVIHADERETLGGALLHGTGRVDGMPAPLCATAQARALAAAGVRTLPRTTVYGHYDGQFAALERVTDHLAAADRGDLPRQRHWLIRPDRVVLACGAVERPIGFAGNDRPGVMLADAVRAYVNRRGVAPGRRTAVFANNDSA